MDQLIIIIIIIIIIVIYRAPFPRKSSRALYRQGDSETIVKIQLTVKTTVEIQLTDVG